MIAKIKIKNKVFEIPAKKCLGIKKVTGLMFKYVNPDARVFFFSKEGIYPIHSLFCKKFVAIWMKKSKIVNIKIVNPWRFSIAPKNNFDTLIEIPTDGKYREIAKEIIEISQKY